MLPNFLCVGAQKAGTTTLYNILKQHPNIYMPLDKELHFFDTERNYKKGIGWYEKTYFKGCENAKVVGEVTPGYMFFEDIPKRIFNDLGKDTKLIFILRNPVDRAYSHYGMSCAKGFEHESFESAISLENKRVNKKGLIPRQYTYISRGFYAKQIKRFLEYFPKENMLFVIFEEFIKDMPGVTKQIFEFLGINKEVDINYQIHINKAWKPTNRLIYVLFLGLKTQKMKDVLKRILGTKLRAIVHKHHSGFINKFVIKPFIVTPLNQETKKMMLNIFTEDIMELQVILGKDLSDWRKI